MLQIPTTEVAPRDLADLLDGLIAQHQQDREIAALLAATREQLRALAWNRYARLLSNQSARRALVRRHKGHGVRRGTILSATAAMLAAAQPGTASAQVDAFVSWLYREGRSDA